MAPRPLLLGLAFFGLLLVAACGGSGDDDPTPTQDAAVPTVSAEGAALPLRPDQPVLHAVAPDGSGLRVLFDQAMFFGYQLSPDGETIALDAQEGDEAVLYFIDVGTGEREEVLRRPWLSISSWSPDGRWLAVSLADGPGAVDTSAYLYEVAAGDLHELPPDTGFRRVWSPDGGALYVGQGASPATLVRVDLPSFAVEPLDVTFDDIALSPDGETFAVGRYVREGDERPDAGYVIELVSVDGGQPRTLVELDDSTFVVGGFAWSRDGGRLAFSWAQIQDEPGFQSGIYVVDTGTTEVTRVTDAPEGVDTFATWSPDGTQLLVHRHVCTQCDGAGSKYLLAATDGSGETSLQGVGGFEISDGAWAPEGERFAYSGDNLYVARPGDATSTVLADFPSAAYGSVTWAPDASEVYFVQRPQLNPVTFAVAPDGSALETLGGEFLPSPDGAFAVGFDPDTGELSVSAEPGRSGTVRHEALEGVRITTSQLLWSPDSARLAVFAGSKGGEEVLLVSARGADPVLVETPGRLAAIRWSPDAMRFAYATSEGITVVDVATGDVASTIPGGAYSSFDWSPTGDELVLLKGSSVMIASADGAGEPRLLVQVEGGFSNPPGVRWSPDGERLAVGELGRVLVLSAETGAVERDIAGFLQGLAWSPDGALLAFSSGGAQGGELARGVYLLDAASGELVQLTEAVGRGHEVRGWLDDGRVVFVSTFRL